MVSKNAVRIIVGCLLGVVLATPATASISVKPVGHTFTATYVGLASASTAFTVTNNGTANVTVISITFSCPEFKLASGIAPTTIKANGGTTHYSVFFAPDGGLVYNCNMVIQLNDFSITNVNLIGTGKLTNAASSLDQTTLAFGNDAVGTTTSALTVNLHNSGTQKMILTGFVTVPANFAATGPALPLTVRAGDTVPFTVTYSPTAVRSDTGVLSFTYDSIPMNGVNLSGTGVASVPVDIATFSVLPTATQSSAYQANLQANGGIAPFTFSLASGSTLPSGLSLSSAGAITGTLATSVGIGTYSFTINVTDAQLQSSSKAFTVTVAVKTGAACNNISFNVPKTTTPITPLTDLGAGTYQGSQGGLYPGGSNLRPAQTDADAVAFGKAIQPLDANGNPSPTGKYVLLSVGESTALDEFGQFVSLANSDPSKNPNLVLVNGSQGGATPANFQSLTSAYWSTILNDYLPGANVTSYQVAAVWIEDTDGIASGTFPTDINTLYSEYEQMARNIHVLFPNASLAYFSSRFYAGYSNGVSTVNPEPYAYEVGFAVKWAIQDQINGVNNLNYKSSSGTVVAPLMIWGPYDWTDGLLGRQDGLVWTCQDVSSDGTHPSKPTGQQKVANQLLNYFKSDTSATPWFKAPGFNAPETK